MSRGLLCTQFSLISAQAVHWLASRLGLLIGTTMRAFINSHCIQSTAQAGRSQWGPPRCCCAVQPVTQTGGSASKLNWVMRPAVDHLSTSVAGLAAAVMLLCPVNAACAPIAIDQLPQPQQQQQEARLQQQPTLPGSTAGFDPAAVGQIRGATC